MTDPHTSWRARALTVANAEAQASALLAGHAAGNRHALDVLRWNLSTLRGLPDATIAAHPLSADEARAAIARTHHVAGWAQLEALAARLADPASPEARFEAAADLVIGGREPELRAALAQDPALIRARSPRTHRSTLLHFVAANGFEDYRQVTPPNAVAMATLLLDAGADVNATSEAYGGGSTTIALVATSAHPRAAGMQLALMDLLLARGATIEPIVPGSNWPRYALANGCPEAAVHLVRRCATPDTLYGAAGVDDLPAVERLFAGATDAERAAALVLAAQCEALPVVQWLLARGVRQQHHDGMTPLHWAAGNGDIAMVEALVAAGGDLEAENEYGGTVLSNTTWFAANRLSADAARRDFPAMFDRLVALGARLDAFPGLEAEVARVRAKLEAQRAG